MTERDPAADTLINAAMRIVDDAWNELQLRVSTQRKLGLVPTRLPDASFAEALRRSQIGRSLLTRLDTLDQRGLPHDLALTLRLVRFRAYTWSREADWYWTVTDPIGVGFFGLFYPTAYCGGQLLNAVHGLLVSFPFIEAGDTDRYLGLVADYARLIEQFTARTAGQAQRGIRMPKVQVSQARSLLSGFKARIRAALAVAPQRLAGISSGDFARELQSRIEMLVEPAFDRALDGLSDDYLSRAPDAVGIAQYPGGAELYRELVKLHTTLDLTPEEIHEVGLARLAEIEQSMRTIRAQLGFEGDDAAFRAHVDTDARWRANTVEGVTAVFQRYVDRLKPHFSRYFSMAPKGSYGVAPLSESLQESMTFGYYETPRRDRPEGRYLFNAANLTQQALINIASLTYHELMPGHHLHLAIQQENDGLHPFRQYSFINAYNEGWAEYAGKFAGEIGLYEEPEERYGRLVFDAFLTCRLVVDTGMNVLGWSLERAREFMRHHGGLAEREIITESLRYSCDTPAQALAYKLGDTQLFALREKMRSTLGARFNLKDFHAAVLSPGALPLPDLEWHLEAETARRNERTSS